MPMYETAEDRAVEAEVAETIRAVTGWAVVQTPTTHPADLVLYTPGSSPSSGLRAFCEVKRRRFRFGRFPTMVADKAKIEKLADLQRRYGVPAFYVCVCDDVTRWTRVQTEPTYEIERNGGRTTQTRRPADIRDVYHIRVGSFEPMGPTLARYGLARAPRGSTN